MTIEDKVWIAYVILWITSALTALITIGLSAELGNKYKKRQEPDVEIEGRKKLIKGISISFILLIPELLLLRHRFGYKLTDIAYAFGIDIALSVIFFIISYFNPSLTGAEEIAKRRKEEIEHMKIDKK